MKKNSKAKANSSPTSKKVNQFKVSPLIIMIAVVEVIVLIGAVTYAWFTIADNNRVESGLITVAPDSGLTIDFKDASKSNYINIWNYLNNFSFEPATSVDGRNIYFPTTGTFNNTATNKIKFREGTVNDVNTKYISVDFTLTNTAAEDAKVYLDNSSTFNIDSSKDDTTGRALRIAFYQNNNKSGDVSSHVLKNIAERQSNIYTVYFNDNLGWAANGKTPRIHIWKSSGDSYEDWPGYEMKHISGDLYYFSFENYKVTRNSEGEITSTDTSTPDYYKYVLFTDGTGASGSAANNQTVDLNLTNGAVYTPTGAKSGAKYLANSELYSDLVPAGASNFNGYAVIAPGVSTGFQRPYAPVLDINNDTGVPTTIVPAYASSIDDYFTLETDNLFTIKPNETQSLSMIIWLEGTDPNCTEDYYAGDKIDLNLVFSVSTDATHNYTYKFFDYTKETWLDDTITENGLSFNPVIQLYSNTLGRGYLMTQDAGNKKLWTVNAPQDLVDDDIEFRRVNPNDESEVWNYWDASEITPQSVFDYVHDGSDNTTVCFTAFADGSPTAQMVSSSANVPAHSCGGLWGKHEVTKFTFVDGTDNIHLSSSNGVVTLNMKYYFGNGQTQTIEYKASSPEYSGQFFRFVVPKEMVTTDSSYISSSDGSGTPTYKFKRYYNFDSKYAINSAEYNSSLTYDKTFTASAYMDGTCAMTTGNGTGDVTYFGTQLAYVQAGDNDYDDGNRSDIFKSSAKLQVIFWGSTDGSNELKRVRLRTDNGEWKDESNHYKGFALVVPRYAQQWAVWRYNSTWSTRWNTPIVGKERLNFTSTHNLYKVHSFVDKNPSNAMYVDTSTNSWQRYGDY